MSAAASPRSIVRGLTSEQLRQTVVLADEEAGTTDGEDLDAMFGAASDYFFFLPSAERNILIWVAVEEALTRVRAGAPEGGYRPLAALVGPGRKRTHAILSHVDALDRIEEQLRQSLRMGFLLDEDWDRNAEVQGER